MADYKVVDAEQLDADLTEIADEVRTLVDTDDRMTMSQMKDNVAQANADVEAQAGLIEQIRSALDGKASASGSEVIAQIAALIDESGVLESTEGTVTDKVEALIDKAEDELIWYNNVINSPYLGNALFREYKGPRLPRFNLPKTTNMNYFLLGATNITSIDWYLDTPNNTYTIQAFQTTKSLIYMKGINVSKVHTARSMFYNSGIVTIDEPFDFSSITEANNTAFSGANALVNVRFVPNTLYKSIVFTSAVLNDESIQSIIGGLADLTGGTAQTLTLHADVKAKLTEEQLATITSKNWNLA